MPHSERRICEWCDEEIGLESHYHCGRCHSPEVTSMMGHYTNFAGWKDGKMITLDEWGFTCDPEFQKKREDAIA